MKKYTQRPRHLAYIQRRARRSLEARLRFQRYKTQNNRFVNHLRKPDRKLAGKKKHFVARGYVDIKAPSVLSFVRNPEEVSEFISELRTLENDKQPAYVILKQVKEIDYDGITVLLSAMVRFKALHIAFNGNLPSDPKARAIILESGFFGYLNDNFKDEDQYDLSAKRIFTHAQKNVDSELGQKIIEAASKTVWGQPRRCPGVQRVLLELMQNTNNHASAEGVGDKHWWLSVKHIKEERRVTFSFVDYGVGVFHSLRNKRPGNKFYGILDRLYDKVMTSVKYGSDSAVLKLIFDGELHRTATGKTYRGKGLPGIYQAFQKNQLSNLSMITNRVVFNSTLDACAPLFNEFQGTFVYWELSAANSNVN